jgi:thiol peroxidase
MAQITLEGTPFHTVGTLPAKGRQAPVFSLTATDLSEKTAGDFPGKTLVLNIFPSIDTSVCATSVRRFNQEAGALADTVVLCVSADLPFAHQRFCTTEGLDDVVPLSVFRSDFGKDYGLTIVDGPLAGLLARAVVIIDKQGKVIYTEQVPEITQEPDYQAALKALTG